MRWLKGFLWSVGAILVLAGIAFWMRPLDFFDDFTYLEEALSGVHNEWTWVDGYRMHYETEGPAGGPPVVLVHGLGGRAEDWRTLAPFLAKAGYHVYMPDLIGYGRSDQPANFSYSVRDEAALVVAFMDAAGLRQVDLGGWSMGGWIAQLAAYTHPERIRRLMIFDSAGLHEMPSWDTRLFTPTTLTQLNELNALLMPHPPHLPEFVATDILRVSKEGGWVVTRAMAQMLNGQDVTDNVLPQLRMPVAIEWGAEDQIIPLDQGEKMHRLIAGSVLDVFPGCGHLAPLQCADEMAPKVLSFLRNAPIPAMGKPLTPVKTSPSKPRRGHSEAATLEAARAQPRPAQN